MSLLLKNEMKKNVITVDPEDSLKKGVNLLSEKNIGCLVVAEKGKPVGIVTERDILKRVVASNLNTEKVKVKDIMTKSIISLDPKNTVEEAAHLLEKKGIKKLPIIENGKLVGIVTMTDIMKAMRKIEEEQSIKIRKVCEDLHRSKITMQTKISELEKRAKK